MYATRAALEAIPKTKNQTSRYICRQCRQSPNPNITIIQRRRYASKNEPQKSTREPTLLEKVRSKLWKGEPPGPKNIDDVYGGPGVIQSYRDQRKKSAELKSQGSQPLENRIEDMERETQELNRDNQRLQREASMIDAQMDTTQQYVDNLPEEHSGDMSQSVYTVTMPDPNDTSVKTIMDITDLEEIGHQGQLEFLPEREEDAYTPYLVSVPSPDLTHQDLVVEMQKAVGKAPNSGASSSDFLQENFDLNTDAGIKAVWRFSEAISFRVPDSLLNIHRHATDKSYNAFVSLVHKAMTPKLKLAEQLLADETIAANPNLLIAPRRETLIDRETEIGRWKMIESELRARGIPVTDSEAQGPSAMKN